MADHNLAADRWLEMATKDEGAKKDDPIYCTDDEIMISAYCATVPQNTTKIQPTVLGDRGARCVGQNVHAVVVCAKR